MNFIDSRSASMYLFRFSMISPHPHSFLWIVIDICRIPIDSFCFSFFLSTADKVIWTITDFNQICIDFFGWLLLSFRFWSISFDFYAIPTDVSWCWLMYIRFLKISLDLVVLSISYGFLSMFNDLCPIHTDLSRLS